MDSIRNRTKRCGAVSALMGALLLVVVCQECNRVEAFVPPFQVGNQKSPFLMKQNIISVRKTTCRCYSGSSFYDDFDNDDEDDDDDMIDVDSLGDWRDFRRNLAKSIPQDDEDDIQEIATVRTSGSKENEELLTSQSKELGEEYKNGVWAHVVSTPEVGGLIVRMPIEVELYRNYRHSVMGNILRKKYLGVLDQEDATAWYKKAQSLIEDEMYEIASSADDSGQIDSATLSDESTEMLQIFLDNQETWQEVCLILERDEELGTAKTLVLNRPMAFKLTENLSRLVLFGSYQSSTTSNLANSHRTKIDLVKFMLAFGQECAVYVGGTDDQDQPAIMIHGIKDLPGAREISPGTGIYQGGLKAAVDGVIQGKYKPLDFRFFVGCHTYEESTLDVSVVLGKYQPVACARSLVLKQCISLPTPLWHEVLELCDGDMKDVSSLEMLKRDDILFQVIEDDDEDMLDELRLDDDDDDYYDD